MKLITKNVKIKINEIDYNYIYSILVKRLMKLRNREKSLLLFLHNCNCRYPSKVSYNLFNCREEIRHIEYILKNYSL